MNLFFDWTRHKELWNWLAEHPSKSKGQWPGWKNINPIPCGYCFACSFARRMSGVQYPTTSELEQHQRCLRYCPLSWGSGNSCQWDKRVSPESPGLYKRWVMAGSDEASAYYTRLIATLPLKSWVEDRWLV